MRKTFSHGCAVVAVLLSMVGCGQPQGTAPFSFSNLTPEEPQPAPAPNPEDEENKGTSPLKVCSKLSFTGVTWASSLTLFDRDAVKVGLNISGSYEGGDGWGNITNNFDGTGLSLGLLNQTLGTGSLEPLLIEMRNTHLPVMQSIFASSKLQSLLNMLKAWESSKSLDDNSEEPRSQYDIGFNEDKAASRDQATVAWADKNLYQSNGRFKPEWARELTALAESKEYVSIQIKASQKIHDRALSYEQTLAVKQLRAYLMLFDVVVQNGSLYSADVTDYLAWLKASPSSSTTDRLNKILELRLRHVKSQYVGDVRSRKKAIIDGLGTVHQTFRQLEKEYCYSGQLTYR